jgi:spermidine/putrescine transport system ATP-binding protein
MDNPGSAAIELSGVSKRYEEVVAVKSFHAIIKKGEFFSLLGPSGCGKTTTLRLIAGLETPSDGRILLESRDVTGVQAYRRNVNTVFQDYALFPHMTVRKNIYFPLKMRKISPEQAEPRIQRVLKLVSMEGYGNRLPQQLSGGQRQRIALARSLVNEPAALLLDEPLGALDFKLRVAMQKVLKDIQRNVGITFVYVTHDQTEAMTMSDRIAVMKDGVVHQIGTPDEIYNTPATAFVASFIGDMNFLRGTLLKESGEGAEVALGEHTIRTCRTYRDIAEGGEVLVGIRSEKVLIHPPVSLVENRIPVRVTRIVFRGADYEATCRFEGQEIRSVVSATGWDLAVKEGDMISVGWDVGNCLLYYGDEEADVISY